MRRERCAQSRTVRSDGKGVATWSEVAYQIDTDDFDCETTFCVVNRSTFQSSIIGKAVIVTRSLIKPPGENKPFQLRVEHRGQSDMTLNITLSSTDALPSKAKLRVKFSMANLWGAGMLQQLLSIKQPEPDPIKDHRGATLAFVMRRRQLDADHPPACHVVLASTKQYLGCVEIASKKWTSLTMKPLEGLDEVLVQREVRVGVLDDAGVMWASVKVTACQRPSVAVGDIDPGLVTGIQLDLVAGPAARGYALETTGPSPGESLVSLRHVHGGDGGGGADGEGHRLVAEFKVLENEVHIEPDDPAADFPRALVPPSFRRHAERAKQCTERGRAHVA